MNEDRLSESHRETDLLPEAPDLHVVRLDVPVVVKPDLTHRGDLRILQILPHLRHHRRRQIPHLVGMKPHRAVREIMRIRDGAHAGETVRRGAHITDPRDAGRRKTREHLLPVGVKLAVVIVRMRVEDHGFTRSPIRPAPSPDPTVSSETACRPAPPRRESSPRTQGPPSSAGQGS